MAKEEVSDKEIEKFDVGMEDSELLSQIQLWEKESIDLKSVWEENLRYYKGIQTGVQNIRGKESKAVENRIWMATETMIPIVTARPPDIVVWSEADDEQSQQDAENLQDILSWHLERVGFQEKAERWTRDLIVKRYGVFKIIWDKENDDVDLRVVDPRRIKIPKYGKSVDDLKFIIEYLEMSADQIEEFFGKDKLKDAQKITVGEEQKVRKENYSICEVWTNKFVVWRSGGNILKQQANPYFKEKNFFDKPRKPYVIKSLFETEESIVGDTDYIQQHISIQDNINKRKRQIENTTGKIANSILLIDSDVMSEEEAANITNEEGLILYGKDAAKGDKIRFEQPGQLPQYVFQDLESSRSEFDNIWGVHSTTRGEREGRETLGGRKLLKQADLGRIDLLSRQLERALDEICEYWTQLIKLFYTSDKTFAILGDDGLRFIKNFAGSKVGKVKLSVRTGSTLPKDEVTIHNEAITLWQLQAIGPKTLYKMLRISNPSEALDDFIQFKNGSLLQGGVAQPAPQPAPQAGEGLQPNPLERSSQTVSL